MDTIQGTDIGQVKSSEIHTSGFAANNPPMDPRRAGIIQPADIPPAGELPQSWGISEATPRDGYTVSDVVNSLLSTPEQLQQWYGKEQPVCGVVTIKNIGGWSPKSVRSIPPSLTNKLGMYLSAQWVMLFNGSAYARRKNRWALVTTRGPVLILSGITLQDRPINPSDFPPCVTAGLTTYEADQLALGANAPRCQFAHVPKQWTVPVRRADTVEMETDV